MENWKKKAIELMYGLILTGKKHPEVVEYRPAKTEISERETRSFKRSSPHKHGISPKRLAGMLKALEEEKRANLHNLLVVKDGEVICECSHPGYEINIAHLSHSMSKTLTGIAIAFLSEEGLLDIENKVLSYFPDVQPKDKRLEDLKIEHLLRMASGVEFAEAGVVTEENWTRAFFESDLHSAPGETFKYNSMNSYILARIAVKVSGRSLSQYLKEKLFDPMGITNGFWELGPEGVEKGGFGVYMSCESWAMIGYMLMCGGVFFNKRIMKKETVATLGMMRSENSDEQSAFNYGYHLWTSRDGREFLINGMLGQNVWYCPENGILVSLNCGNNELFQESPALNIVRSFLGNIPKDEPVLASDRRILAEAIDSFFVARHWIKPKHTRVGLFYFLGIREKQPFDKKWMPILGKYAFPDNNNSILPLFVTVMQSNYSDGIKSLSIERRKESIFFIFDEGEEKYEFEAGFYDFKETILNIRGEKYILRAMAQAIEDEDRNPIFKLELIFPELPNTRIIKINIQGGRLNMRMSEMPNEKIAEAFFASMTGSAKVAFIIGMLEKKFGQGFVQKKLHAIFNPTLMGIDTAKDGYEAIIAAENAIAQENRENSSKLIGALLNKFILDDEAAPEEESKPQQNFIMRAINGLLGRSDG